MDKAIEKKNQKRLKRVKYDFFPTAKADLMVKTEHVARERENQALFSSALRTPHSFGGPASFNIFDAI